MADFVQEYWKNSQSCGMLYRERIAFCDPDHDYNDAAERGEVRVLSFLF